MKKISLLCLMSILVLSLVLRVAQARYGTGGTLLSSSLSTSDCNDPNALADPNDPNAPADPND